MLETYCTECHNSTDWAGGVAFDTLTPADVPDDVEAVGSRRAQVARSPDAAAGQQAAHPGQKRFHGGLARDQPRCAQRNAARRPRHGAAPEPHRVRQCRALAAGRGDQGGGSAAARNRNGRLRQHRRGAERVAVVPRPVHQRGALHREAGGGHGDAEARRKTPVPAPGGSQDAYVDGLPLGSRGGMAFKHYFPADGEYRLSILDLDVRALSFSGANRASTLVVLVDGKEVFRGDMGGKEDLSLVNREGADGRAKVIQRFSNIPVTVTAGTHEVVGHVRRARPRALRRKHRWTAGRTAATSADSAACAWPGCSMAWKSRVRSGRPAIGSTASRDRIFVCHPQTVAEEQACARQHRRHLARRAYRRPVSDADEVDQLMPFFTAGRRRSGNFDGGVQQVVMPRCCPARTSCIAPSCRAADGARRARMLTDLELASRLSFFLWSDGAGRRTAGGRHQRQAVRRRRLSSAGRAHAQGPARLALVDSFALRWLNVDDLEAVDPDPRLFPHSTSSCAGISPPRSGCSWPACCSRTAAC